MQRITAAERKAIASLGTARGRRQARLFTAEGLRGALDFAQLFPLRRLVVTAAALEAAGQRLSPKLPLALATARDMQQMSTMTTPPGILAVLEMPPEAAPRLPEPDELVVALDDIQDPGNLGTIVRTCAWMGVRQVVASPGTADIYNPKALQATMGGLGSVSVAYGDLEEYLGQLPPTIPIYGTMLDGDNLYTARLSPGGVIVMGNEAHGLSPSVAAKLQHSLRIPSYPPSGPPAVESLNVAMATGIILAAFRRDNG